jgi:chitodextrinase
VKGDGQVSMAMSSANDDGARYLSKEAGGAIPQLQVTCGSGGTTSSDTSAPSAPTGLKATASSATQVDLAWIASTDNVGVTGYRIYRNGATTPLATVGGTTTAYSDKTAAASTAYTYQVSAVDAAGNESAKSATASATTPAATSTGGTLTFTPTDDATVDATNATTNYGSATRLTVDAVPVDGFLLKFTVSGTAGCTVSSAQLKLTVGGSTNDNALYGGDLYGVASNTWSESTVTWNTRPAAGTTKVASVTGSVALNTTYTWDATSLVKGDGTVSMYMGSPNDDGARYLSKEAGGAIPKLLVTCA